MATVKVQDIIRRYLSYRNDTYLS